MMRRPTKPIRPFLTAVLTAGTIVLNATIPSAAEPTVWSSRHPREPLRVAAQKIATNSIDRIGGGNPAELLKADGIVRDVRPTGSFSWRVIHIQDIHRHAEAQNAIARMLRTLVEREKATFIALEGAFGPIDIGHYRSFPVQDPVRHAADYLFSEQAISGPVHAALTNERPFPPLIGIEDRSAFERNVQAYREAVLLQPAQRAWVAEKIRENKSIKEKSLNPSLRAFDLLTTAYRNGSLPLIDYLTLLREKSSEVNHDSFAPQTEILLAAARLEKNLDFGKIEDQRNRLSQQLLPAMNKTDAGNFLAKALEFRAGATTHAAFYAFLFQQCSIARVAVPKELIAYGQYVQLADRVDPERLSLEIKQIENEVAGRLVRAPYEENLLKESRRLHLLQKLIDFSLTPVEWEEYRSLSDTERASDPTEKEDPAVQRVRRFEEFYRAAVERNRFIVDRMKGEMARRSGGIAVLIAGGFHSRALADDLSAAGVSVTTISPKISSVNESAASDYLSVFQKEKTPLEKLFASPRVSMAPPPAAGLTEAPVLIGSYFASPDQAAKRIDPSLPYRLRSKNAATRNRRLSVSNENGDRVIYNIAYKAGGAISRVMRTYQPRPTRRATLQFGTAALGLLFLRCVGVGPLIDNLPEYPATPSEDAYWLPYRGQSFPFIHTYGAAQYTKREGDRGQTVIALSRRTDTVLPNVYFASINYYYSGNEALRIDGAQMFIRLKANRNGAKAWIKLQGGFEIQDRLILGTEEKLLVVDFQNSGAVLIQPDGSRVRLFTTGRLTNDTQNYFDLEFGNKSDDGLGTNRVDDAVEITDFWIEGAVPVEPEPTGSSDASSTKRPLNLEVGTADGGKPLAFLTLAMARRTALERRGHHYTSLATIVRNSNLALDIHVRENKDIKPAVETIRRALREISDGNWLLVPEPGDAGLAAGLRQAVGERENVVFISGNDFFVDKGPRNNVFNVEAFLRAIERAGYRRTFIATLGDYDLSPQARDYFKRRGVLMNVVLLSEWLNGLLGFELENDRLFNMIRKMAKLATHA